MTPAEQLKARMRLLLNRADQQNAAATSAAAADDVGGASGGGGWTRFVLDKFGTLDEDKQAMQQVLDVQVGQAGFGGGDSADVAASEVVGTAAFIMGTGRAAARKAAARSAAEQAHEDAIFGGGVAGGSVGGHGVGGGLAASQQGGGGGVDAEEASTLGLAEGLLVQQQKGASWRERALAKRQQQQQ